MGTAGEGCAYVGTAVGFAYVGEAVGMADVGAAAVGVPVGTVGGAGGGAGGSHVPVWQAMVAIVAAAAVAPAWLTPSKIAPAFAVSLPRVSACCRGKLL